MGLAALEWQRPWACAALALPLLVLLLSLRRERPASVATGTFAVWRGLGERAAGARARRRVPPARWLLALALTLGVLALAAPRRAEPRLRPTWRVVVDRSPSMYLAHGDGTRLDAALALVTRWREDVGAEEAELEWEAPAPGGGEAARAREFPRAWRVPPAPARAAPRWELFDRAGTLLVTDRAPDAPPAEAGLAASGGPAVPGPIASEGSRLLAWDANGWRVEAGGAGPRALALRGALPEPLERIARAWAAERGLEVRADARGAALVVAGPTAGASAEPWAEASSGSWSLRARPAVERSAGGGALEPWLQASSGGRARTWVAWRVGLVAVDLVACEEPAGDPAAFAVAWSRLFDAAVAPAPGVVAADERSAAGPSELRAPRAPLAAGAPTSVPLVTWLAGGAALAGLLACLASRPGRRL